MENKDYYELRCKHCDEILLYCKNRKYEDNEILAQEDFLDKNKNKIGKNIPICECGCDCCRVCGCVCG